MPKLQIYISKETAKKLKSLADKRNITAEDLLKQITKETVRYPDGQLDEAVKKVLKKNKELYRRLAN